ncbi:hypothetical protein QYF61_003064 [Mycteria americana]|uniref:Uncharacterized protein n=1 Tax=Mycteria americana TaxID=33587 RepID=A0AAN7S0U8_MYCAM|nr:hypothetical protein QYF61_003064 [Mycteria americana]
MLLCSRTGFLPALPDPALALASFLLSLERTRQSLERRRLRGNLIALYSFLRRGSADLFSLGSTDRTREWFKAASGEVQTRYGETFLYREHGQTLEQASKRGGQCPMPVSALKRAFGQCLP